MEFRKVKSACESIYSVEEWPQLLLQYLTTMSTAALIDCFRRNQTRDRAEKILITELNPLDLQAASSHDEGDRAVVSYNPKLWNTAHKYHGRQLASYFQRKIKTFLLSFELTLHLNKVWYTLKLTLIQYAASFNIFSFLWNRLSSFLIPDPIEIWAFYQKDYRNKLMHPRHFIKKKKITKV